MNTSFNQFMGDKRRRSHNQAAPAMPGEMAVQLLPSRPMVVDAGDSSELTNKIDTSERLTQSQESGTCPSQAIQPLSCIQNGLNGEKNGYPPNSFDLEVKIHELTAALEASGNANTQLMSQIQNLEHKAQVLSETMRKNDKEKTQKEEAYRKEYAQLQEQLAAYVAQNTELWDKLAYAQRLAQDKANEASHLDSRLQISHRHLAELEISFNSAAAHHQHFEKLCKNLEKQRSEIKMDMYKIKIERDQAIRKNAELMEKLSDSTQDSKTHQSELQVKTKELEGAELRLKKVEERLREYENGLAKTQGPEGSVGGLRTKAGVSDGGNMYMSISGDKDEDKDVFIKSLKAQIAKLVDEREELLDHFHDQAERLTNLEEEVKAFSEQKQDTSQLRSEMKREKAVYAKTVVQLQQTLEQVERQEATIETLRHEIAELNVQLQAEKQANGNMELRLVEAVRRRDELERKLTDQVKEHQELIQGNDGLREMVRHSAERSDRALPEMEAVTRKYHMQTQMMEQVMHESHREKKVIEALQGEIMNAQMREGKLKEKAKALVEHIAFISEKSSATFVTRSVFDALHADMEKLQVKFVDMMEERVTLIERLDLLESRCRNLPGGASNIGELGILFNQQEKHLQLVLSEKEGLEAKLAETQALAQWLLAERNQWVAYFASGARANAGQSLADSAIEDGNTSSAETSAVCETGAALCSQGGTAQHQ
ncbi:golgin subfamily A member 2-like isoform X2 [Petromyzon marinus]|uniref:Golgin subfamily A member 2-like isoform X2 n=1 Tax=Petromyzon marinus TaxID=7757 RepID=A0AAJ7TDJ0_PETMA|nr:golgin subfamily A member 2-like isoform X2 [Petromyzon marinus]